MKPSARILAVLGLRIETRSRSPREAPGKLNIALHSDWSGKGGRADRGVSLELEVEGEEGFEVEVEYGEERDVARRMRTLWVDETNDRLKSERGARFSSNLGARVAESIVLLDPHALRTGGSVVDGTGLALGW